jgi:hypothetical protein
MVSDTVKRHTSRQHFIDDAAECPDVRAFVDRLAARLLRAHVRGCAQNHAFARIADRERLREIGGRSAVGRRLRQPEVEDFDDALRRDLDIRRLEIAVNDSFVVRRFECLGDLPRDRQGIDDRDR